MTQSINNIKTVSILTLMVILLVQTCTNKQIIINNQSAQITTQHDTIKAAQKKVDSIAGVKKIISDIVTTIAKKNEELKKANDSLQQQTTEDLGIATKDSRIEIKESDEAKYLRVDVQLLAAQRDSLIALNKQLSAQADSVRKNLLVIARDTAKIKIQPVFFPSYVIGGKYNMPTPSLRITGQIGLIHGFTSHATYLQFLARQYFGHLSTNEFVNIPVIGAAINRPAFSASLNLDILTYEKKIGNKK